MINANKYGKMDAGESKIELTPEENKMLDNLKAVWNGILNIDIDISTDFFKSGAGSMDVVR
jgi:formyltetrahydrofolate dehydrogenase